MSSAVGLIGVSSEMFRVAAGHLSMMPGKGSRLPDTHQAVIVTSGFVDAGPMMAIRVNVGWR